MGVVIRPGSEVQRMSGLLSLVYTLCNPPRHWGLSMVRGRPPPPPCSRGRECF